MTRAKRLGIALCAFASVALWSPIETQAATFCAAPPSNAVLCADFEGATPLSGFTVTTPTGAGQQAMAVSVIGGELAFDHVSGFGVAATRTSSALVVQNKKVESLVRFGSGALNPRSFAAVGWSDADFGAQNSIALGLQKDENLAYLFVTEGGVTQRRTAGFATAFDVGYVLSLVTRTNDRVLGFVGGVKLFDVSIDLSMLPTSMKVGVSGNSRGVPLRYDNLLVSQVPIPSTLPLLAGGLAVTAGVLRGRRRRAAR